MSGPTDTVYLNGSFVARADARIGIDDRGLLFAESLYEVLPFVARRPRLVAAHHARLREGARRLQLERGVPQLDAFRTICVEVVERSGLEEGRVYFQITGGEAPRRWLADPPPAPNVFAHVLPHRFPRAEEAARGVTAIVRPDPRWAHPSIKSTMLLHGVLLAREARAAGATETILVDREDRVVEGASSSVFLVEDGRLVAPESGGRALSGITAGLIRDAASEDGRTLVCEPVGRERMLRADEVILASTSRLAAGVSRVDDRLLGDGDSAGPVARGLAARLRARYGVDDGSRPAG